MKKDFKFRFVDSNLKPKEIKKLTAKEWQQLYNYQKNRDKRIINASVKFSWVLLRAVIIFIAFLIGMGVLTYLTR